MTAPPTPRRRASERDMLFFANPHLWPCWPFLAVVRRHQDDGQELGVMYDAKGASGLDGYSATVWLTLCGPPHKVS